MPNDKASWNLCGKDDASAVLLLNGLTPITNILEKAEVQALRKLLSYV